MDSNMVRFARTAMMSGRTADLLEQFGGGGGGGGGGFGGGGPAQVAGVPRFTDRPGEGAVGAAGRGGRGGAAGAPGGAPAGETPVGGAVPGGPPNAGAMQAIFGAFRGMQDGPLGRAARGGGAPLVKTGEYLLTFIYGDEKQKQVLRVERVGNITGVQGFGGEDAEDRREDDGRTH